MSDTRFRVMNKCHYDQAVKLPNGQSIVIKANSFQMLTADDIAFIESVCKTDKLFAKRMLVACSPIDGKEVSLAEIGMYFEEDPHPHLDDSEIEAMLKQSAKKIETWLSNVDDPAELHCILEVAKKMDLTASKLKVISDKMPARDIIE